MDTREPVCHLCGLLFSSVQKLNKHLAKTKPCNVGKYACGKCDQHFDDNSNCHRHRKTCKGRHVLRSDLIAKYEEMQVKLNEFESCVSAAANEDDAENDDNEAEQTIDVNSKHKTWILSTIVCVDPEIPQMYFFEAGPKLVPLETPYIGIVIKLGWTDSPYTRTMTHKRDFGGGRVLDSIICNDPKGLESKFKKYMRMTDRLIRAKVATKPCVDTEVFIVKDQEEYAGYVAKAIEMAASFGKHLDIAEQMRQCLDDCKKMIAAASSSSS